MHHEHALPVVAAIICRHDRFLLTKRLPGTHMAGRWEFPGGKVEAHETPQDALVRELSEELGILPAAGAEALCVEWQYPMRKVRLTFWWIFDYLGVPTGREGQALQWVSREALSKLQFPEANQPVVSYLLNLPERFVATIPRQPVLPGYGAAR